MRSALPATRQAAGVPSAWSQPSQSTHKRPRRWCDAGPLRRQCVTAAQKAGAEDWSRNGDSVRDRGNSSVRDRSRPEHAAIAFIGTCRVRSCAGSTPRHRGALRTTTLPGTPRGARCGLLSRLRGRPPACHRRGRSHPNRPTSDHADGATLGRWDARASQRTRRPVLRTGPGTATASGTAAIAVSVTAPDQNTRQSRSLGRAGYVVVPDQLPGTAARSAQLRYRALHGERDAVFSPGYEAGRRRAIGVVAAIPIDPQATTPMVRRWAVGTPERHSGAEGRC